MTTSNDADLQYRRVVGIVFYYLLRRHAGHVDADARAKQQLMEWGVPETVAMEAVVEVEPPDDVALGLVSASELEQALADAKDNFWDAVAELVEGEE